MRLVIGSRKSDLARIQAYTVGAFLKKNHPHLEIAYHFRESLGDANLNDPLWKMPEKGVFTEDFHQGLMRKEYDLVVHSWKDLPMDSRPGTEVVATLPREDVRDVLLLKKTALGQKSIQLLTSSPRRIYNLSRYLKALLPHGVLSLEFCNVRGNVQTRVKKMMEGEAHGLIVAKAALDRLLQPDLPPEFYETQNYLRKVLSDLHWMVLPISLNPPAAAQGALAIEVLSQRQDLKDLFQDIQCKTTYSMVEKERRDLRSWGGGCHQKIGVCYLQRDYGVLKFAQGVQDHGDVIDQMQLFLSSQPTNRDRKKFPEIPQQSLWFDRVRRSVPAYENFNAHWVSKAEALPESVQLHPEKDLVWTSGVKTWMHLAARGIWVHGSSESLGEKENLRLKPIDSQVRHWCKWAHLAGEATPGMTLLGTYELVPKSTPPKLDVNTQHFFWMSGSSFREALKHYPWLLQKTHWCGPGNTFDAIHRELKGQQGHVHVAINFEQWQKIIEQL